MERIIMNGFKYATDWVNCGAEVIYEIDGENVGVNKTNFDISLSFKWFFSLPVIQFPLQPPTTYWKNHN